LWGRAPGPLEPVDEHVEAGCESLVAVVQPHVLATGDEGGEAVTGKRPEEFVVAPPASRSISACDQPADSALSRTPAVAAATTRATHRLRPVSSADGPVGALVSITAKSSSTTTAPT